MYISYDYLGTYVVNLSMASMLFLSEDWEWVVDCGVRDCIQDKGCEIWVWLCPIHGTTATIQLQYVELLLSSCFSVHHSSMVLLSFTFSVFDNVHLKLLNWRSSVEPFSPHLFLKLWLIKNLNPGWTIGFVWTQVVFGTNDVMSQ